MFEITLPQYIKIDIKIYLELIEAETEINHSVDWVLFEKYKILDVALFDYFMEKNNVANLLLAYKLFISFSW